MTRLFNVMDLFTVAVTIRVRTLVKGKVTLAHINYISQVSQC